MKRTVVAFGFAIAAVVAFVFLVPIIPSTLNGCPPNAFCPVGIANIPDVVSVSYYAVGVGGRIVGTTYQILFWPGWICSVSTATNGGYDCHQIIWSS